MKKHFLFLFFILTFSIIIEQYVCFQYNKQIVKEYSCAENVPGQSNEKQDNCIEFVAIQSELSTISNIPSSDIKVHKTDINIPEYSNQIWQPPKL